MSRHLPWFCLLTLAPLLAQDDLIPFDARWEYPHFLNNRPGDGQVVDVDPPRFSWSWDPAIVTREPKPTTFRLQVAATADFAAPVIDKLTPDNFDNALPPLGADDWFWRVEYRVEGQPPVWGKVRRVTVPAGAVRWDRTSIDGAAGTLAARAHPRLTPAEGWAAWRQALEADPVRERWLKAVIYRARQTLETEEFRNFPTSDQPGATKLDDREFADLAHDLAQVAFARRLTDDEAFLAVKERVLTLAGYPRGGMSSPEFHAKVRKWPTQITEYLAVCYDWLYPDLTAAEREAILASLDWRLKATYLEKYSWRSGEAAARQGVAVFAASHPYENFMWSLPAVLLTAGDLPVASELTPMVLNYLTGVTSAHGPDEGWNEGLSYGVAKGNTMLNAAVYTDTLLSELDLGRSPYFRRLARWYAHLLPLGLQRTAFGDYARTPDSSGRNQRTTFRYLSFLTGDPLARTRYEALLEHYGDDLSKRAWLPLFLMSNHEPPATAPEATRALFPEAGWVMVSSRPPSSGYDEAVGMIFKSRPRGGYSHSYRAENDFVWHAYGQALSAGGGNTAYPDPHARSSLSHNVVLINGVGQEWDPQQPKHPYVARLLACHDGDDLTWWAADATHAYQTVDGLARWHRYVAFVDQRWFAIFDDLAMADDAPPVRFSWLFHVAPEVPLTLDPATNSFRYDMDGVRAQVALAAPGAVELQDLQAREGFKNPITGDDMYAETAEKLAGKGRELPAETFMRHNLWVTNREPTRTQTYLAALLAWRDGDAPLTATFPDPRTVVVTGSDGYRRSVSFDPANPADIVIDVSRVRRHAETSGVSP